MKKYKGPLCAARAGRIMIFYSVVRQARAQTQGATGIPTVFNTDSTLVWVQRRTFGCTKWPEPTQNIFTA